MTDPNALHGDGINFPFFNLLWSKNSNDEDGDRQVKPSDNGRENKRHTSKSGARPTPIMRVPDTVVFLFGQPHQWYFTSKNGGPDKNKTTIMRKKFGNLTLANIEEVFLNKAASRGEVGDDDVVAYFICSKGDEIERSDEKNAQHASLNSCSTTVDDEASCNIEYFNEKTLRKYRMWSRPTRHYLSRRSLTFPSQKNRVSHHRRVPAAWKKQ